MDNREGILITGASGYVGQELLAQLLRETRNSLYLLTSNSEMIMKKYAQEFQNGRIRCFERKNESMKNMPWDNINIIVNLAFARKHIPQSELVESWLFSKELFTIAKKKNIPAVMNISSQSVYGSAPGLHNEESFPCPLDFYALAKCANEIIIDSIFENESNTRITHVRLDSIAGNKNLIPSLVRSAWEKGELNLVGGQQVFSLLDVRDAASGIVALCQMDYVNWQHIYNLGWHNTTYTLVEIAEIVAELAEKRGAGKVKIRLEENDTKTFAGIDTTRLSMDTGWQPQFNIYEIIEAVIDNYLNS